MSYSNRKFGAFKKYSKKSGESFNLNNHFRNLTFDGEFVINNNQSKIITLISNNDAAILYNENLYNESNIFSQVFSGPIKVNGITRTYLLGVEDLTKVKGQVELINSISNDGKLVNDSITVEVIIDYEYKRIETNPMITMITESFKYKYMNERYTDFNKKTNDQKEEIKNLLNNDRNYEEQKKKLLDPFLNYVQYMLYNNDVDLSKVKLRVKYNKQMLISTNDKPQVINFSFYPTKPVSPYLVNYVLNGWTVKMRIVGSSFNSRYVRIHSNVLVMDKMTSYMNRDGNLNNKFFKLKELFEKLKNQNKRGTDTFEKMLSVIQTNNPILIDEGKRIGGNVIDFVYRKIQLGKIWLTNSYQLNKENTTVVLLNRDVMKEVFGNESTKWRMKVKKIYINFKYRVDEVKKLNYPITVMLTLHSWNPKKKQYFVKELIYGTIFPNNIEENHKTNKFIIQDERFTQFYYKNDTDWITITFDYSEKGDIGDKLKPIIDLQQCIIKYKPIINLRSKVQNDMEYYLIKVLEKKN